LSIIRERLLLEKQLSCRLIEKCPNIQGSNYVSCVFRIYNYWVLSTKCVLEEIEG